MDTYERAALADFVASVIWPSRTIRVTTASEQQFDILGTWVTATDAPLAWIDGQRVTGAITWVTPSRVQLPAAVAAGRQVVILVHPGAGSSYLPRNGLSAMLGNLAMGAFRITGLAPSVAADDAVRRDEVISIVSSLVGANYLLKSGGVMTGHINLPGTAPAADQAVRRDRVALLDGSQAFTAPQSGVAATAAAHLVTKAQLDAVSGSAVPAGSTLLTTVGAQTFTVPAGVTRINLLLVGGGGAGGRGTNFNGLGGGGSGGGGGGTVVAYRIPVTPAQVIAITVGQGGQTSAGAPGSGNNGQGATGNTSDAGGDTTALGLTARGGAGGVSGFTGASNAANNGGPSAAGGISDLGANGSASTAGTAGGAANGGAGGLPGAPGLISTLTGTTPVAGAGSAGANGATAAGGNGTAGGGGGGSGDAGNGSPAGNGGTGGNGLAFIWWGG